MARAMAVLGAPNSAMLTNNTRLLRGGTDAGRARQLRMKHLAAVSSKIKTEERFFSDQSRIVLLVFHPLLAPGEEKKVHKYF